jgi:hypothetical protein
MSLEKSSVMLLPLTIARLAAPPGASGDAVVSAHAASEPPTASVTPPSPAARRKARRLCGSRIAAAMSPALATTGAAPWPVVPLVPC